MKKGIHSSFPILSELWVRFQKSSFVKDVWDSYLLRILQSLLGLGSAVLLARLLGPAGTGQYSAALVLGTLGMQFAHLGIHWSNNYYLAQNRRLLAPLIANSLWVGWVLGGILALFLGLLFTIWPQTAPVQGWLLVLALAWIPLCILSLLLESLLVSLQHTTLNNLIELGNRVLKILLMAVLWAVGLLKVETFFGSAFLVLFIHFGVLYWFLRRTAGERPSPSWTLFKKHMNYGLKAYFSGFFYFLVLKVDQLMVQYQCGSASTGFYSTAVSMGDAVCILPSVICVVLFPRLSSIKDLQKKWGMARQAVFWTAAGILPFFFFAGVLARPLVGILFGDRYLPSLIPFLLLLPGLYFLSIQWVASRFLYSLGYPKQVIANWVIAAVFNIVLNLWAIPRWGIEGASVTSSATYLLVLILTLLTIRRYIRSGGKNRLR